MGARGAGRSRTTPQATAAAAYATPVRVCGPGRLRQHRAAVESFCYYFGRGARACESMRNESVGSVECTPAARGRAGGATGTYYEKNVHQGCLRGRLCMTQGRVT